MNASTPGPATSISAAPGPIPTAPPTETSSHPAPKATHETQVLVIDDSETARAAILSTLESAGISAIELPSPIGATRTILRSQVRVVVIDVHMPTMRGDKLARLFRERRALRDLKVVLISGTDEALLRQLGEDVGADATLSKDEARLCLPDVVRSLLSEAA